MACETLEESERCAWALEVHRDLKKLVNYYDSYIILDGNGGVTHDDAAWSSDGEWLFAFILRCARESPTPLRTENVSMEKVLNQLLRFAIRSSGE